MANQGWVSVYVKPPKKLMAEIVKMPKKSKVFKRKCLQDYGDRVKGYAKINIAKGGGKGSSNFTGSLSRGILVNVYDNNVLIRAQSPHAMMIERGFSHKRKLHRDLPTWGGGTVGNWMDSRGIKGDWITVGSGPVGKSGIRFMEIAKNKADTKWQEIIDSNRNELALGK